MGWLVETRPSGRPSLERCDEIINCENESGKWEVLKSAMVGTTYYAAVRRTLTDGSAYVFAAVFLTSRRGGCFGYKDMDESVGPCESTCPTGILNMLSPTDSKYANDWRARCRENAAKKRNRVKLKPGDVIKLEAKISFSDGYKGAVFEVVSYTRRGKQRKAFKPLAGSGLYRIPNIHNLAFTMARATP